jgi:alanyl-tRNA synthetase
MQKNREKLYNAAAMFKAKPAELGEKIQSQMEEIKNLKRAIETFKTKESAGEIDRFLFGARMVSDLRVITATIADADAGKLRQIGDLLRDKEPGVVAVLSSGVGEKITFLAVCGKDAVAKGIKAGDLVKLVCTACGGSGGGKPDSAMGGGKDATKVDNALAMVDDFVQSKLN